MTVAKLIVDIATAQVCAARNDALVFGLLKIHKKCVLAVPQHADARTVLDEEPEFEYGFLIKPIESLIEFVKRFDALLEIVEENGNQLRRLTFDMRGLPRLAGAGPLDGRVRPHLATHRRISL